jgi:hypothetical protein
VWTLARAALVGDVAIIVHFREPAFKTVACFLLGEHQNAAEFDDVGSAVIAAERENVVAKGVKKNGLANRCPERRNKTVRAGERLRPSIAWQDGKKVKRKSVMTIIFSKKSSTTRRFLRRRGGSGLRRMAGSVPV